MAELGEFAKHYDELRALDVQVLGVSVDSVQQAQLARERLSAPFPILSDSDRKVMELYGTRSPVYRLRDGSSLNTPTLVLIDRKGIVRWIHQAEDYRIRAAFREDLQEIHKLKTAR
jgi:peroxiredoxin